MSSTDRSISRGRQPLVSSGRGGAGNIRQPSVSKDARPESGPDDFSQTRGRELNVPVLKPSEATHLFSTGRGGAGNMRSPSRDPQKRSIKEEEVIKEHQNLQVNAPVSSGRGGLGNISRSRVRDAGVTGKNSIDEKHEDGIKKDEYHSSTTTKHDAPIGDGYQSTGVGKVANEPT